MKIKGHIRSVTANAPCCVLLPVGVERFLWAWSNRKRWNKEKALWDNSEHLAQLGFNIYGAGMMMCAAMKEEERSLGYGIRNSKGRP